MVKTESLELTSVCLEWYCTGAFLVEDLVVRVIFSIMTTPTTVMVEIGALQSALSWAIQSAQLS
jgi:hypothetical protein